MWRLAGLAVLAGIAALCALMACRETPAALARAEDAGTEARRDRPPGDAAAPDVSVTPVASSQPPYDLAEDLASRRARASVELGPAAVFDLEGKVFLFAAPGPSAVNDAAVSLARRALPAYFNGRFARPPARAVTVYVFAAKERYRDLCARHLGNSCASDLGTYNPETREVFVDASWGVTTLTHELVHPIVQTDFPDAPAWINEGLGSLFEQPIFGGAGEIHGAKNWRHRRLLAALASAQERDLTRVDALFGMADTVFYGPASAVHFATARYLCQWLDSRGWLWPFYAAWRDGIIDDPTGEKAFTRVTGMTPAQANRVWVAWVTGL